MAIQAAGGTYVNATSSTLAARSDMQAFVRDNLITAGWSVISGGGTGDTLLQSADTPAGFHCQLRCLDPGSGNCAQFTMRDTSGIRISSIGYMLPTNGRQFRIIANKYQFFVYATGATESATAREIMMGGVPYLPSNVSGLTSNPNCFWFVFTGDTDLTTTSRFFQFRNQLFMANAGDCPAAATLFNDVLVNYASGSSSNRIPALECLLVTDGNTGGGNPVLWADGSLSECDAVIAWSGGTGAGGAAHKYGQIWDAAVLMDAGSAITAEATVAIGGHNYIAITNNAGITASKTTGRLAVRVS